MNKVKFAVMRRLAELAMGKDMKEIIKRYGPLACGALLVGAGVLRFFGHAAQAESVEQLVSWAGFQTGISPSESFILAGLATGLGLKIRALWLAKNGRAPMKPPVLQTEAQMNDFVAHYQVLLASMPWDEARKLALAKVFRDSVPTVRR